MNETTKRTAKAVMAAAPVAMALGAANPAAAAPAAPAHPLALQVGVGLLTGNAGDVTQKTGIHVGASYEVQTGSGMGAPGSTSSIDLDENYNSGNGGHIQVLGITVDERAPLVNNVKPGGLQPYAGIGIGVFNIQGSKKVTTTTASGVSGTPGTTTTSTVSKNATTLGGKIMLGVEMGETFAEASYNISGSVDGVRTDSLNFSIGTHF